MARVKTEPYRFETPRNFAVGGESDSAEQSRQNNVVSENVLFFILRFCPSKSKQSIIVQQCENLPVEACTIRKKKKKKKIAMEKYLQMYKNRPGATKIQINMYADDRKPKGDVGDVTKR